MKKDPNRWLILFALCVCFFCSGAQNMWSIFNKPFAAEHGWLYSQVTLAYSLMVMMVFITGFFVGRLQEKVDSRWLMLTGAILWGSGWFLAGTAQAPWQLYLYFSLIGGLGDGFIYNTILTSLNRWFPDKKGLANGIALGVGGLTPLPMAPFGNYLLENLGVTNSFHFFGIFLGVLIVCVFWLIPKPAADWIPPTWRTGEGKPMSVNKDTDLDRGQMIRTAEFYLLVAGFFIISMVGTFINSQASNMGQDMAGITAAQAALAISIMTVVGFIGRISLGVIADRYGRTKVLFAIFLLTLIDLVCFAFATNYVMFVVCVSIFCFTFGGSMPIYPSVVSDTFGNKYFGANWSIFFAGYSIAALFGPMLAAASYDLTQSYNVAIVALAVLTVIALVCTTVFAKRQSKKTA